MHTGLITFFFTLLFVILCIIVFCFLLSACHNDMYGPDCMLSCKCQNGGVCNRFSGCQCPTGWRGQNCEKSGIDLIFILISLLRHLFHQLHILCGMELTALILYIYSLHHYTMTFLYNKNSHILYLHSECLLLIFVPCLSPSFRPGTPDLGFGW